MLPSANRLTKSVEINKVKAKGKMTQSDSFSLLALKKKANEPTRFAFIVSTKVSKNATIRNKSKRAMREGVRHSLVYLLPGFDCVLLAKPNSARKYTDEIMKEVELTLKIANITK